MISKIRELYFFCKDSKRIDCIKVIKPSKKVRFSVYGIIIFFIVILSLVFIADSLIFITDLKFDIEKLSGKQKLVIKNILIVVVSLIDLMLVFFVIKENLCNCILVYKEYIKFVQNANIGMIKNEELLGIVQNASDSCVTIFTKSKEYNINLRFFLQKDIDYIILLLKNNSSQTSDKIKQKHRKKKYDDYKEIIEEMVFGSLEAMLLYEIIVVIFFFPTRFLMYYYNIEERIFNVYIDEHIFNVIPSILDISHLLLFIIFIKFHMQFSNYLTMLGISKKVKGLTSIFLFLFLIVINL